MNLTARVSLSTDDTVQCTRNHVIKPSGNAYAKNNPATSSSANNAEPLLFSFNHWVGFSFSHCSISIHSSPSTSPSLRNYSFDIAEKKAKKNKKNATNKNDKDNNANAGAADGAEMVAMNPQGEEKVPSAKRSMVDVLLLTVLRCWVSVITLRFEFPHVEERGFDSIPSFTHLICSQPFPTTEKRNAP